MRVGDHIEALLSGSGSSFRRSSVVRRPVVGGTPARQKKCFSPSRDPYVLEPSKRSVGVEASRVHVAAVADCVVRRGYHLTGFATRWR
eukprot:6559210-Prymnesium_polylepis.2